MCPEGSRSFQPLQEAASKGARWKPISKLPPMRTFQERFQNLKEVQGVGERTGRFRGLGHGASSAIYKGETCFTSKSV